MKRSILVLVLGVFVMMAAATAALAGQNSQEPAKQPAPPQKYQLILFKLGPAW